MVLMASEKSSTALRTIGEVAEDLDVATHVLRFWESKFHQIKPQKRRGRRYYRPEDVNTIQQIKELLYVKGYTIRGVQKVLSEELRRNVDGKSGAENAPAASSAAANRPAVVPVVQVAGFAGQQAAGSRVNQGEITSFKTDMFGNIIPSNQSAAAAPFAPAAQGPLAVPQPLATPGLSVQDIKSLEKIYDGLLNIRDELKSVA